MFCGLDDLEGKTSIEGLWVAGAELTLVPAGRVAEETEAIQAPLNVTSGFDPN